MNEKQKIKEIFGKEISLKILKYEDKREADNLWKENNQSLIIQKYSVNKKIRKFDKFPESK